MHQEYIIYISTKTSYYYTTLFIQINSPLTIPTFLIKFGSAHSSFYVIKAHKNAGSLSSNVWHLWDGEMEFQPVQCAVNRRSLANIPSRGRILISQESHKKYPSLHCSESVYMNDPAPGIGTDQQNNWPHSWHSSIYPGPSQPTFSN